MARTQMRLWNHGTQLMGCFVFSFIPAYIREIFSFALLAETRDPLLLFPKDSGSDLLCRLLQGDPVENPDLGASCLVCNG